MQCTLRGKKKSLDILNHVVCNVCFDNLMHIQSVTCDFNFFRKYCFKSRHQWGILAVIWKKIEFMFAAVNNDRKLFSD